jgi:hypothetical protein
MALSHLILRLKIRILPKDALWIGYGIVLMVYGTLRGPVTSDEALYWIIRRSYSFALFHFPLDAIRLGLHGAAQALLRSLDGAGAVSFYGKPVLFFLTIPLSIFSMSYATLIVPTAAAVVGLFAFGVRRLSHPVALALWCGLFLSSPLVWLFGAGATGNALAGALLVFAILALESAPLSRKWRWFSFGFLVSIAVMSHYSVIPAAAALVLFVLWAKRHEEDRRTLLYAAAGAGIPLVLTLAVTFALQLVFTPLFGAGAFLNYVQDVLRQAHAVAGGDGTGMWYYPHVLLESGNFAAALLLGVFLAFVAGVPREMRFRFSAAAVVLVAGFISIDGSFAHAGRTTLDIIPAAYLCLLVLLEAAQEGLAHAARWARAVAWGFALCIMLAGAVWSAPRLASVIEYRNLGDALQQAVEREHPVYGTNPYIEGYLFHFFRYAFLTHAEPAELYPGWRAGARIWAFEGDPTQERGRQFIAACGAEHRGVIEHMDWSRLSTFNWVDDAGFGEKGSYPFVLCFAPPSGT